MSVSGISVFQAKVHSWRYWNSDGLPTIITGFAMILQGVAYFWLGHHPRSLLPGVLLLSSAVILLDQITLRKIAGWLKTRITYPRTGYAAPPPHTLHTDPAFLSPSELKQQQKAKRVWISLPFLLALSFYAASIHERWYLAFAFMLLAGFMCFQSAKGRFAWYVPMPMMFFGLLLILLPTSWTGTMALGMIGFGTQSLFMGALSLSRYLREHPVPQA